MNQRRGFQATETEVRPTIAVARSTEVEASG
jgi:hypothetical protein